MNLTHDMLSSRMQSEEMFQSPAGVYDCGRPPPSISAAHQTYEPSECTTMQVPKQEVVDAFSVENLYCCGARCSCAAKFSGRSAVLDASLTDGVNITRHCRFRFENSLAMLTRRFMRLIKEVDDGTLDLNRIVDVLKIQKRRIYDITNVLEGIGLIEKTTKNQIRWKGSDICSTHAEVTRLKDEVGTLCAEESRLDECLRNAKDRIWELTSSQKCKRNLFVSEKDLLSLPTLENKTNMVIQAPRATSIEALVRDEEMDGCGRNYELIARSFTGPINVHLLSKELKTERPLEHTKHSDPPKLPCRGRADDADTVSSSTSTNIGSLHRIVPSIGDIDEDYWLISDCNVRLSDLWGDEIL